MTIAFTLAAAAGAVLANAMPAPRAASLDTLCTSSSVAGLLPYDAILGVTIVNSTVGVNTGTYNSSGTEYSYCNVTFQYEHDGVSDADVWVQYILPDPSTFKNRYLSTGGGGNAINSGVPTNGLAYGAVGGRTDGGFGGFDAEFDTDGVDVLANGTVNIWVIKLFGYLAHHEMAVLGKQLTRNFYSLDATISTEVTSGDGTTNYVNTTSTETNGTRLYSYYQACSEGGREGWSQLQRFGDQFDGAVVGAPAFRYAHQQANHMFSAVVEQTLDYVPPPCELEAIVTAIIDACDPLDGRTDGVISRSDLCLLNFNLTSVIGTSYYCAASTASSGMGGMGGGSSAPEQSGNVSALGVEVAQTILDGLHDSNGNKAYLSWAIGASFADATSSTYNNATGKWELPDIGIAATWIGRVLLGLQETDMSLTGIDYDQIVDWMYYGWQNYFDTLHTTWPDLSPLNNAGGKVIHYHGEADNSVPVGSSVHYYETVASTMYPSLNYTEAHTALAEWYRLYLIPGAAHCATNSLQPNGPWPTDMLSQVISWVEDGVVPTTLSANVTEGDFIGSQDICAWPLRPYWNSNTSMVCQYDQASIDTWQYTFPAFKLPVW